ncbi:sensor histidine kinase [Aquimarina spongiae]|nr:sensor histidine kinase [Aquimarina spongiae]
MYEEDSTQIDYPIFLGKIYAHVFNKDSSIYWLDKAEKLIDKETLPSQLFQYYLWKGYAYEVNKNYDKALNNYFFSKKYINHIKKPYYLSFLYQRVLLLYSENQYKENVENWIYIYTKIKDSLADDRFTNSYHNALGKHYHYNQKALSALEQFNESIEYSKKLNDSSLLNNSYFHKGIIFAEYLKIQDSARYYYNLGLKICNCKKNKLFQATYKYNIARTYYYENDLELAKKWLLATLKDTISSRKLHIRNNVSKDLYSIYKQQNQKDSSFYYLELHKLYGDSLSVLEREKATTELQAKYDVSEKEKLNLILQNQIDKKQHEQRLLWIGSISLLMIGVGIGVLIYKNTKRKQRIAEQEKEIEIQKTEKLLKDQELAAIDAMIEGQEKERQRLANDLHDNLGSTLATVKLHFDHLKNNHNNPKIENIEELYGKTNDLLDEAYQKVRTIAHEKNSGVMANQGLLTAIKNLAKKVSSSDQIQVEVQDYGLDERLDNSLEISIFRMIQELITNCIKHAEANEIHVSLTNHESLLNIIIEDNGKGFDPKTIVDKDGMGLKTIEKRVEHLEGTFEIDSTPNQGTNIIINIPI